MNTSNWIKNGILATFLVAGIIDVNAQAFEVTTERINVNSKMYIDHLETGDCLDITTKHSTSVLGNGDDLVWLCFFQQQPNNPGIFGMTSMSAGMGWNDCFTILANGNTGIFNAQPSVALEIGTSGSARQVKVNGSIVLGSDIRMKDNIRDISNALKGLKQLRSVSYTYKESEIEAPIPEKFLKNPQLDIEKMKAEMKKVPKTNQYLLERNFYGFLAQDMQKVFPDLVYADSAGMLSIDYIGIIPLLVDGFKEQQTQIDALRLEVEKLKGNSAYLRSTTETSDATGISDLITASCILYQNTPNPFQVNTEIRYFLPKEIQQAYICIFDMQGQMLKKLDASAGDNALTIRGSELQAGMYLYSLIADGKEVDTKRMILTK
jgi:hypothetical protein